MTPSQRIRAAALGPTPNMWFFLMAWIKDHDDYKKVRKWCVSRGSVLDFGYGSEIECRMFLLFVAEALES